MAGSYRALLIGNSTYPADEHNLQSLKGPVKDIAALNRALVDRDSGLFADVDVTLLPEVSSARAVRALGRFFGGAERDDVLLFYFSGHGKLDHSGRLHLCMQDTESTDLLSTAVSSSRLNEFVDASRATHVVIVLDCCYAGAFRGADLGDPVAGPGRYVMTSCRSTQLANDATVENGTSYFTQHLVDGLVEAAADSDGDGYIGFSDLYSYIDRQLRAEGKQIPLRRVDGDGDLRLARRPARAPDDNVPAAPPRPVTPPPGDGAPPRRALAIGLGIGVVVVAAAVIVLLALRGASGGDPGGSSSPTGPYVRTRAQFPTSGTYPAAGPWRIQLDDTIEDHNNGCDLQVTEADSGAQVKALSSAYDLTTVQIPRAGRFQWRVNDPECHVVPLIGVGSLRIPAYLSASKGDSAAFPVSGRITVAVKDFQGGQKCRLALFDATDGTQIYVVYATPAKPSVTIETGDARTAYLSDDNCAVRIDPA